MLNICTEEYEHDDWATMHDTAEKLYKYISDIENLYGIAISEDRVKVGRYKKGRTHNDDTKENNNFHIN